MVNNLKVYMKENFNITPENIDMELERKRRELQEKIRIMGEADDGQRKKPKAS